MLYNDRSPMENHHLAASFQLMNSDEYNFLRKMPNKTRVGWVSWGGVSRALDLRHSTKPLAAPCITSNLLRTCACKLCCCGSHRQVAHKHVLNTLRSSLTQETLRKQIIEMVLATDMKQHFAIHSMFQAKMQLNGSVPSGGSSSGGKTMRTSPHTTNQDGHKAFDEDQRSLVLQVGGWRWPPQTNSCTARTEPANVGAGLIGVHDAEATSGSMTMGPDACDRGD